MVKRRSTLQTGMRMLAALALLFLSFAHQPVFSRQLPPQIAADYMLPDGTVAEICFGLDGVRKDKQHGGHADNPSPMCEACRLSGSMLLPPRPDDNYLIVRMAATFSGQPHFKTVSVVYPRILPPSQAPPGLI